VKIPNTILTIMEFSEDRTKLEEDSSVDFLAEPIKLESGTSLANDSIDSTKR
jgi:hypothetical protein